MIVSVSSVAVDILAALFVVVSLVSLAIQSGALLTLLFKWPIASTGPASRIHRGLLRTSICRVVAAVGYVVTGSVILISRDALPYLSLSTFTGVQVLWIVNAFADVRLRRRLAEDAADNE
jgi:hypothetical protein